MSYMGGYVNYTTVAEDDVITGRLDAALCECCAKSITRDRVETRYGVGVFTRSVPQRRGLVGHPTVPGIYILSSDPPTPRPPKNP